MAIIYSYPLVSSLDSSNLFPLTATNEEEELYTANVTFSTLVSEIIDEITNGEDRYIPRFDGDSLVNSVIYEDSNNNIGIGTTSPDEKLHVNGDIMLSDPFKGRLRFKNTLFPSQQSSIKSNTAGDIELRSLNDTLVLSAKNNTDVLVPGSIEVGDGVYIGGTDAANKLDDYEEGTFIPNLTTSGTQPSISFKEGRYTKIGDTVFVEIRIRDFVSEDESNAVTGCTNLPFTVLDTTSSTYVTGNAFGTSFASDPTYAGRQYVYALDNTTTLTFRNGNLLGISFEADTTTEISASIIYKTS